MGTFRRVVGHLIPVFKKEWLAREKFYRNSEQQMEGKNWNVLGQERGMLWLEIGCEQMKERRRICKDGLGVRAVRSLCALHLV